MSVWYQLWATPVNIALLRVPVAALPDEVQQRGNQAWYCGQSV